MMWNPFFVASYDAFSVVLRSKSLSLVRNKLFHFGSVVLVFFEWPIFTFITIIFHEFHIHFDLLFGCLDIIAAVIIYNNDSYLKQSLRFRRKNLSGYLSFTIQPLSMYICVNVNDKRPTSFSSLNESTKKYQTYIQDYDFIFQRIICERGTFLKVYLVFLHNKCTNP